MRDVVRILFLMVIAFLAVSCERTPYDSPELIIWLDIERPAATKGEEGNVPAENSEDNIKDLRIWVFLHDPVDDNPSDDVAIGYIKPDSSADPLTQYENSYHIPLTQDIAQSKPTVDIYVIGNPGSVGQSDNLNANTNRGTLNSLTMSNTRFGVNTNGKPTSTSVPSSGLPYTGVAKGLAMTGSYPVFRVEMVTVRKAVSKFRFVFCQLRDDAGSLIKNLQITGLSLTGVDANGEYPVSGTGDNICSSEYLFNDSPNPYKLVGYRTAAISFDVPTSVRRYAAPEEYVYNPPSNDSGDLETYARQYEALIDDGINNKKVLTEAGKCYLRETDKKLSGKVSFSYELGGQVQNSDATFTMADAGDFVRGRSWIVYVYFLRDAMHFSVSWTGWANGGDFLLTPVDPRKQQD